MPDRRDPVGDHPASCDPFEGIWKNAIKGMAEARIAIPSVLQVGPMAALESMKTFARTLALRASTRMGDAHDRRAYRR